LHWGAAAGRDRRREGGREGRRRSLIAQGWKLTGCTGEEAAAGRGRWREGGKEALVNLGIGSPTVV